MTYLVLVDNNTVELIVEAILAITLFHDLVDIEMVEASACCELLAVCRLSHAGSSSDDDVR